MRICIFDKQYWGQGVAPGAIKRVVEFAADDLHLNEISAGIEPGNCRSCGAFERAGFTRSEDKPDGTLQYRWSRGV